MVVFSTLFSLALGISGHAQQPAPTVALVTTFVYPRPGYGIGYTGQISDKGEIVGDVLGSNFDLSGFARTAKGKYTKPFVAPGSVPGSTLALGVNSAGLICGSYQDPTLREDHGFFLMGKSFTTYDAPGATATKLYGLNDAGGFVGSATIGSIHGLISIGGAVTTFAVPGASATLASGVNAANQVVGFYYTGGSKSIYHAYYRDADGSVTNPLDYPGSTTSGLFGINATGTMVGYWTESSGKYHGYLVEGQNTFVSYDVPGAVNTFFTGISDSGMIVGYYQDSANIIHGFIAQLSGN